MTWCKLQCNAVYYYYHYLKNITIALKNQNISIT